MNRRFEILSEGAIHKVRLRLTMRSVEWKLFGLLVCELVLLNPASITILSNLPPRISMQDPRTASSAFRDFADLERAVAINEFGSQRIEAASKVHIADCAQLAVIPQLRDEVDRNQEIIRGSTRLDIPDLLRQKADLARKYRPNPKFLLAPIQKQARIPYLLGAFLALSLLDEHWTVSYGMAQGIELRMGEREIQPFTLVERLDTQAITAADFRDMVM